MQPGAWSSHGGQSHVRWNASNSTSARRAALSWILFVERVEVPRRVFFFFFSPGVSSCASSGIHGGSVGSHIGPSVSVIFDLVGTGFSSTDGHFGLWSRKTDCCTYTGRSFGGPFGGVITGRFDTVGSGESVLLGSVDLSLLLLRRGAAYGGGAFVRCGGG